MAGMLGDVAQPEQVGLAESGIVTALGRCLPAVPRPHHHVVHRALRAVAIQHFQRQFLWRQLLLDAFQRHSDLTSNHAFGRVVTRKPAADEIARPAQRMS